MSVQSEIDRIITAVGNAYSKVSEKGGTVPASQTVANLATAIDSIPAGAAKETWVIKSDAAGEFATTQIAFTSNGRKYTSIGANYDGSRVVLYYGNEEIAGFDPGAGYGFEFYNEAYRKLTFDTSPAGALLTWLQSNATKQPDDTAVQDTKAVTITSNGTVSVTPDAPYDGLSSVDVTVNVASGGEEMVNVSFKDTNFNRNYTIYSYDENGNLFCVIDNVQINSTPSVFTVAKRGFVITGNYNELGGGSADGLRFSGMTPVTDTGRNKSRRSWGFIVTGDNPSLEVYDNS